MNTRSFIFIGVALTLFIGCKVNKQSGSSGKNKGALASSIEPYAWQAVGPFGAPAPMAARGEWTAHGTGRFECINVHPDNENEILIGHATSGLFKSTDGGVTWQQKLNFEFATGIFDILRFRKNNKHLIACSALDLGADKIYGYGLVESFDGGETWQRNSLQYQPYEYHLKQQRAIAIVDKRSEQRLISVSNHEIYLSKDGAKTWNVVYTSKGNLKSVKVNPDDEKSIIVTGNVMLASNDGGETWNDFTPAVCSAYGAVPGPFARYEVCFSEINNNQLWIAVSHNSSYLLQADATYFREVKLISKSQFTSNMYHMTMGVNADKRARTEHLYVGTTRLFKSINNGVSFNQMTTPENNAPNNVHDDVNNIRISEEGIIYIVTDGGANISKDAGLSWQSITDYSTNLNASLLFGFDRSDRGIIMTGTQDKGLFVYRNNQWSSCRLYGDGGRVVAINDSNGFACGFSKQCYKTADAGNDFTYNHAGGDINFFDFRMDYSPDSKTLYIANQHLYKQEEGKNFEIISSALSTERPIGALWVNHENNDEIWMAKMDATWGGPLEKKLYYTADGGLNWQDRTSSLPIAKWRSIVDINVNEFGDIVIALGGFDNEGGDVNKVYLSTDGGNSFENMSEGLGNYPVNAITSVGNQWVCGTANGVWVKRRGESWQKLGSDFPATIVTEVKYFEKDKMLYVSTFGRGIWRMLMD